MKKTSKQFVSALAGAAVAFATLFSVGCADYRDDIDELKGRVDKLEGLVETLQQQLDEGSMIESVTELPDGTGWRITFTGGSSRAPKSIDILHGEDGSHGTTPRVEVKTNPDGTTSLWIDDEEQCVLTGVAPKIEVRPGTGGKGLYIWYNTTEGYPAAGWKNTGVDITGTDPLSAIVENQADGTVTFILNDGKQYTFAMSSTAQAFEIMATGAVEFAASDSRRIGFRVNPSTAWIPTGEGDAIAKWALDQIGTRASYVTPSEVFSIDKILPDGEKKGQYVVTVTSDVAMHNFEIESYDVMLVLNNNKSTDADDDVLVSSGAFRLAITAAAPEIVAEGAAGENHYWTLNDLGTFTVTGTGAMPMYSATGSPWHSVKGDILRVVIADGVTTVGPNAFHTCPNLERVSFQGNIEKIDQYGFYACPLLVDFTIPTTVLELGNNAFQNCTGLKSIAIPNNVTKMGSNVFNGCSGLESVSIGTGINTLGSFGFAKCTGLTTISIPGNIVTTGTYAFQGCSNLARVTLGNGIETISNNTFDACPLITTITIPGSVKTLGNNSFNGAGLTSISIPASVTTLGTSVFRNCKSLTGIEIPDTVTSLGNTAFQDCTALSNVTIGRGVPTLGSSVFNGCTALGSIVIPDNVTTLGASAFANCTSLRYVTIGGGITNVPNMAFYNCPVLTSVTVTGTTVPALGLPSNFEADGDTLYVPEGSLAAWQGSDWNSAFTTITDGEQRAQLTYLLAADWWSADYIGGRGVNSVSMRLQTCPPNEIAQNPYFYDLQLWVDCSPIDMSQRILDIPVGTYEVSAAGGAGKLHPSNTKLQPWVNGIRRDVMDIVGGTMVVTGDHNHYEISFDMTLGDGSEFHADFVGRLDIINSGVAPDFSQDVNAGEMRVSDIFYYPEALDGIVDGYMFIAMSDGLTIEKVGDSNVFRGAGWILEAQLSATVGSGENIPDGTYTVADGVAPGRFTAGVLEGGSWLRYYDNGKLGEQAPLKSGTLISTRSGSSYTMTLSVQDSKGHTATGTVTGTPTIWNTAE